MHERGGEAVSEDRGSRGPAARAPALLVTEHGGHFARCREAGAMILPSAVMTTNSGGPAS